jgi:hypothetical protein
MKLVHLVNKGDDRTKPRDKEHRILPDAEAGGGTTTATICGGNSLEASGPNASC